MCVHGDCFHRYIGILAHPTSLFNLTCPECEGTESFATIIPHEYSKDFIPDN